MIFQANFQNHGLWPRGGNCISCIVGYREKLENVRCAVNRSNLSGPRVSLTCLSKHSTKDSQKSARVSAILCETVVTLRTFWLSSNENIRWCHNIGVRFCVFWQKKQMQHGESLALINVQFVLNRRLWGYFLVVTGYAWRACLAWLQPSFRFGNLFHAHYVAAISLWSFGLSLKTALQTVTHTEKVYVRRVDATSQLECNA